MNKKDIELLIYNELEDMLSTVTDKDISSIISMIKSAKNIVTIGAGRMGYSIRSFTMRLNHLGYNAFHLGDVGVPRTGEGDLIIVASSSGETKSNIILSQIAKDSGSKLLLFTLDPNSTIGRLSDYNVILKSINTKQLMKTAPEHATYMLYDIIALKLSEGRVIKEIEHNHSILE